MPGFDGTGPLGRGPMSGRGRGFCVLRFPSGPGETVVGYAGRAGWPVARLPQGLHADLAALRHEARQLETALNDFRRRIGFLQDGDAYAKQT